MISNQYRKYGYCRGTSLEHFVGLAPRQTPAADMSRPLEISTYTQVAGRFCSGENIFTQGEEEFREYTGGYEAALQSCQEACTAEKCYGVDFQARRATDDAQTYILINRNEYLIYVLIWTLWVNGG